MSASAEPSSPAESVEIGILGGTGKLGAALAQRWANAGLAVMIGSRAPERARSRAAELAEPLRSGAAPLGGGSNAEAAQAPVVVAAIPTEGSEELVGELADVLAGKVLVSALSPLDFDGDGPRPGVVTGAGSAAELLAQAAPQARVVGAFHTVSAVSVAHLERPLDEDVLLCGDDDDALAVVAGLVDDHLAGARAVVVGPLRLAPVLEGLTAVLIATNKRHRVHAGVRLTGL